MFKFFRIPFWGLIVLLLTLTSCSHEKEKQVPSEARKYSIVIEKLYQANIDSAYRYAKFHESTIINLDDVTEIINLYSFFTEIYQYNYPDEVKALEYTAKIIDVINSEGITHIENPYIYINIGNILLKNSMFNEASVMYSNAVRSAIELNDQRIIALICDNIASLLKKIGDCKKAAFFFNLSNSKIEDKQSLQYVQNVLHRIDNQIVCKDTFNLSALFQEAKRILLSKSYEHDTTLIKSRDVFTYYSLWYDFHILSSKYYKFSQKIDSMSYHLFQAKKYADLMMNEKIIADLNFEIAQYYLLVDDKDKAFNFAKSAFNYYNKIDDVKTSLSICNFMLLVAPKSSFDEVSTANKLLLIKFQEEKTRQEKEEKMIKIAQSNAFISLNNYRKAKEEQEVKIKYRNIAIVSISLFAFLLIITFVLILKNNQRLFKVKLELARRSIELIRAHEIIESKAIDESPRNDLREDLERLMKNEKLFLMSKIKLSDVAEALGSNQTYVSQVVNNQYGLNFNDYINSLRVQHFCRIIDQLETKDIVIDAIYSQIGFTSKSTFYSAFKKFMGLSPVQYVKLKNQKSFPES